MELEYLKVANNPIMWISVLPGVLLVIVQAIVLSRRAIVSGRKMGITERQFKSEAIAVFNFKWKTTKPK